ncbi:MAG: crossover junction endodeoxyribonuclease RuvC [Myxococcales bacterium]|nr:crossover junction endodeoxyribonuclease RuvC [Myxococcales bacterium]USN50453.1 MAG: crossover junction endodeoxyribonuclease RuvC [Myxococcales bacterium]
MEKILLGIDPGSLRTGFGIVSHSSNSKVEHVTHGTIVLDAKKNLSERLSDLACDLKTLIEKYQPHYAVVEGVFFCKNARSALVLGQARGVALAVLGLNAIPVQELSPTQVKSLVAGRGRAQKFQVAQIVALNLGIAVPCSEDASDALALALACSYQSNISF